MHIFLIIVDLVLFNLRKMIAINYKQFTFYK